MKDTNIKKDSLFDKDRNELYLKGAPNFNFSRLIRKHLSNYIPKFNYKEVASDYSIQDEDFTIGVVGLNLTVTLPDVKKFETRIFVIKNLNDSVVTVNTSNSSFIDGLLEKELVVKYDIIKVQSTGKDWIVI